MGNLPHQLTNFVGRRHELAEVRRLLSDSRLVTVTGPGGVGKTRLALRVGEDAQGIFADGVWLVELGELSEPSLLAETVTAALGLRERVARPPLPLLVEFLADRHVLIVLDNCEHLVTPVAEFATELLRSCPGTRILATSREPLGVNGEVTVRVPPLTVPDPGSSSRGLSRCEAVTLFTDRARDAVPGFGLTEDNQDAVAEICRRLDGLPLAIELAAARVRMLAPVQILQLLTNRYELLTAAYRGVPPRHQTLKWCVDWSYELCTPHEQELWRRLAVFSGGVESDAVTGICAGSVPAERVPEIVGSLVEKSILSREDGPVVRYRMLDTIREYGLEKLDASGESGLLRRRHRDWYEALALQAEAAWIGPQQLEWIARFDRDRADLRGALEFSVTEPGEDGAALRMAGSLFPYWVSRGLYSEGRYWIERALTGADGSASVARLSALTGASMIASMQGDVVAAQAFMDAAQGIAGSVEDATTLANLASATGYVATFSGDFARATACFESALITVGSDGALPARVGALVGLAMVCGLSGDSDRAIASHKEVIALTEAHGESMYRAYSLCMLGIAVWERGDSGRATRLIEEALRLTRMVDDPLGTAMCLEVLGWLAGDPERAAALMGASAAVGEAAGSPTIVIRDLFGHHDRVVRESTDALGSRAYETAFGRGRGLGVDAAVAYALRDTASAPGARDSATRLTRRERQVADLVAQGLTNKAIAQHLVIAQRTAEGHVEKVLTKLGFTSRTQIAAWVAAQDAERE
ncbi:ATP-binding protein [Rhodococcus olei]|uniref:ATP-binding protein n=1 Tax=Rhodococcus olei TaxID=2161675 RepID=UPI0031EC5DD2